jgi:hypothetical protein
MTALLETNRGDVISGFSEAIRDMVKECRLAFAPDGVKMVGMDSAHIATVECKLPARLVCAEGSGTYGCSSGGNAIEVGIDTKIMAKCLSSVSCGDLVSFGVNLDEDPDHMTIKCQNPAIGKRCSWSIITPDMYEDPLVVPPIEQCGYNGEVSMSSLLFHDMMRDLTKSDATSVRICCDGERLVLVANGRHIRSSSEVLRGGDGDPRHFSYRRNPADRWPVCECFSMTFIQKVAKAKAVASTIHIYLKPNFAIAFTYGASIGTLTYIITPREDDEWMENPETRVMPALCDDIKGIQPRQRTGGGGCAGGSSNKKRVPDETAEDAPRKRRRHDSDRSSSSEGEDSEDSDVPNPAKK